MTREDFDPFIRVDMDSKIIVSVIALNEQNQVVNDLCNQCKLTILREGTPNTVVGIPTIPHVVERPTEEPPVATLQPAEQTPPPPQPKFVPSASAVQPTTLE